MDRTTEQDLVAVTPASSGTIQQVPLDNGERASLECISIAEGLVLPCCCLCKLFSTSVLLCCKRDVTLRSVHRVADEDGNVHEMPGSDDCFSACCSRLLTQLIMNVLVGVLGGSTAMLALSLVVESCMQLAQFTDVGRAISPNVFLEAQSECLWLVFGAAPMLLAASALPVVAIVVWVAMTGQTPGEQIMGIKAFRGVYKRNGPKAKQA